MFTLALILIVAVAAWMFAATLAPMMWLPALVGAAVLGLITLQTIKSGKEKGASNALIATTILWNRSGLAIIALISISLYLFMALGLEDNPGSATAVNPRATFEVVPTAAPVSRSIPEELRPKPEVDGVVQPGRLRLEDIQVR